MTWETIVKSFSSKQQGKCLSKRVVISDHILSSYALWLLPLRELVLRMCWLVCRAKSKSPEARESVTHNGRAGNRRLTAFSCNEERRAVIGPTQQGISMRRIESLITWLLLATQGKRSNESCNACCSGNIWCFLHSQVKFAKENV